jgi:IS605 OrfB family transposase
MVLRRTVRVVLDVPAPATGRLHATIDQYRVAADHVVETAWPDDDTDRVETRRTALHEQTYATVREATDLPAQLVQSARNRAADALSGVVARWEDGQQAGKPTFTAPSIRYDSRSATIRDDHATLATVDGRVRVDFRLPDDPAGTPHERYLFADNWEIRGADLIYDDVHERFWLHVRCERDEMAHTDGETTRSDADEPTTTHTDAGHRTVLGVDCGIENLAVASTGRFWSGDELAHWRREYERRQGECQAQGTRVAKAASRRIARRARGYYDHVLHRVSREIVAEARAHDCVAIAMEDLTDIRESLPGGQRFHAWAFARLQASVAYKAATVGIATVRVDPANTSRRCSRCGHVASGNRRTQTDFRCTACDYEINADYNAAKNVGLRACGPTDDHGTDQLQPSQTSAAGGAPEGVRLTSGMLTASGAYIPADHGTNASVDGQSASPR